MELLVAVAGAHDAGVEAAENQVVPEEVLEQRQGARVVDAAEEDRVEHRQVGDVPRRSAVGLLGADLLLAADQGLAHLFHFRRVEHRFQHREAVDLDLVDSLFEVVHDSSLSEE